MSPRTPVVDGDRLRRVQAGARATLALGIGASLTANMLAARPSLIGRLVAGWSPVALMLTVELLSRVPTSNSRPVPPPGGHGGDDRRDCCLGVVLAHGPGLPRRR